MIATPENALCDLVANTPHVNLWFVKEASIYLEEDLRLDMDRFAKMDPDIFKAYTAVGKKCDSIRTLLKLLKHEQRNL